MYDFDFQRPASLAEALEVLARDEAQALAGGQTLIPTLKARLAMPETLISLAGIEELRGICRDNDGRVCIGAMTTNGQIARDLADEMPGVAALAGRIGDPAVRNRGTIGGSLANNDPAACWPAAVLGCGATVRTDRREIAADDFFDGLFTTALDDGEVIVEVKFPVPEASAYAKFDQPASRFALVGAFVARFDSGVRVAVTGASQEGVFRWTEAEAALDDAFRSQALDEITLSDDDMLSDLHGSADYRAQLVAVMTRRAVAACA